MLRVIATAATPVVITLLTPFGITEATPVGEAVFLIIVGSGTFFVAWWAEKSHRQD